MVLSATEGIEKETCVKYIAATSRALYADVILSAAARRLTSTGGGGVTGELMLMLYLNHTNEQEQKSEKSS